MQKKNKIMIQPYTFTLPNLYKRNINLDYKKLFNDLILPQKKNIYLSRSILGS